MGVGAPEAQDQYELRCEWSLAGVHALAAGSAAVIIVDVPSFSTAADIAVARGAAVSHYRWREPSAAELAAARGALLAGKRAAGGYSRVPACLRAFTAGLRNCQAVTAVLPRLAFPVAVISAGQQWPPPDPPGAGAVLAELPGRLSPASRTGGCRFRAVSR
jgi:2-phosphosulfolactate phosphatase